MAKKGTRSKRRGGWREKSGHLGGPRAAYKRPRIQPRRNATAGCGRRLLAGARSFSVGPVCYGSTAGVATSRSRGALCVPLDADPSWRKQEHCCGAEIGRAHAGPCSRTLTKRGQPAAQARGICARAKRRKTAPVSSRWTHTRAVPARAACGWHAARRHRRGRGMDAGRCCLAGC